MRQTKLPRGFGVACLLAIAFVVMSLRLEHVVAIGYGGMLGLAHVSRSRWKR